MEAASKHEAERKVIEREVLAELKSSHGRSPKYSLKEDSQEDIVRRHSVEIVTLHGVHVPQGGGLKILDGTELCNAEEFAARHFQRSGFSALFVESVPVHVLFGVFLWMLIEDPDDPLTQPSGFGDRNAFETKTQGSMIWLSLPSDFGSAPYAARRAAAIEEHFDFLEQGKELLLETFEDWRQPSERLRQYLWAHKEADIDRARELLKALPPDVVISILRFLVRDYWARYLGWPDLLCYRGSEFFFAEVKSSKDKLSQQQKEWIGLNAQELRLPFKIVKVQRVALP